MDQYRIPLMGHMNSAVIESNLIPEYDRAVVSSLYIYNKMWTEHSPEPEDRWMLRATMYMQQRRLCASFWRFIGAA